MLEWLCKWYRNFRKEFDPTAIGGCRNHCDGPCDYDDWKFCKVCGVELRDRFLSTPLLIHVNRIEHPLADLQGIFPIQKLYHPISCVVHLDWCDYRCPCGEVICTRHMSDVSVYNWIQKHYVHSNGMIDEHHSADGQRAWGNNPAPPRTYPIIKRDRENEC